jgi:hypothetical protein
VDATEAEQALQIIRKGSAANSEDWQRLFSTVPYQQLKAREAAIGGVSSINWS